MQRRKKQMKMLKKGYPHYSDKVKIWVMDILDILNKFKQSSGALSSNNIALDKDKRFY